MAKKFRDLATATLPPAARRRAAARTTAMLAEMPLQELRRARQLSQDELAKALRATQGEISRIERRADLYVSTLRRYIEAMGGRLMIVAEFPDGAVRIRQFGELDRER